MLHESLTKPSDERPWAVMKWTALERGLLSVGYHIIVDRLGGFHSVRPIDTMGCHTPGFNHRSIAVCLVGGLSENGETIEDNFTDAQRTVLRLLIGMFQKEHPEGKVVTRHEIQKRRGDNTHTAFQGLPEMVAAMKVTSKVNLATLSAFMERSRRRSKEEAPSGAGQED